MLELVESGDPAPAQRVLAQTRTEAFWLLRMYRALMPRSLRTYIARRLSPEVRNRMVLRAASGGPFRGVLDRAADAWFRLRHPAVLAIPGSSLVREDGRIRIAHVRSVVSPLQARRDNLDLVCAALTAAGVPYFCVRPLEDSRAAVGVSVEHRTRVLAALQDVCAETGAYAGRPEGRSGMGARAWQALADAPVIQITRYFSTPAGSLVLGDRHGCDVEFWDVRDDRLLAPRANRVAEDILADGETVEAPEEVFTRLAPAGGPSYPTRAEFTGTLVDDITFPIDVVYTWVDGDDPTWRARRDAVLGGVDEGTLNEQAANDSRYISRDELRFSLRSLEMHAPWVRHIWIVTDDQVPAWLDESHSKITVVDHKEVFGDRGALPTFNSHAIESQLHHIDGLAEHFLYFNDDFFLGRPVTPHCFFHPNGVAKFFLSKAHVALGERSVTDLPVLAAGKNNRRLIEETFGPVLTQKMKHVPYVLRRSVLAEIAERFAEEAAETSRHQFRHPDDIAIPSSLHHYYGFLTGRSVPGEIEYSYTDLADRDTPHRLRRMLSMRQFDVFCLNDTDSGEVDQAKQLQLMAWFLEEYFSVPSPYELSAVHSVPGALGKRAA